MSVAAARSKRRFPPTKVARLLPAKGEPGTGRSRRRMLRARSDLLSSLPTIITGVTTHSILETFIRQTEDARKRGREVVLKPPMTAKQIGGLERRCRTSLHAQERELVEYTEGVTIDGFEVDFSGEHAFFEFEALTPAGIPIAADGFGNFWVVDIAEDGLWSRVLFICHDPLAVALQARDLADFLAQVFEGSAVETARRLIDDVWERDWCLIPVEQAITSEDEVLRAFAEKLGDRFSVVDLRAGEVGTGFAWGRGGPRSELIRNGRLLMFGVEKKKPGLLGRLLSKMVF